MTLSPAEAIVLAGGAGTRLRAALPDVPKVLAPVHGQPFLERLLSRLASAGIESVVLATGYAAPVVEATATGWQTRLNVAFSRETEPLGTAGAIFQAFQQIRDERAWVLNGDSFCDADLEMIAAAALQSPEDAWLVAVRIEDASRFGTIELEGTKVVRYIEKAGRAESGWINAGIYILPRSLMKASAFSIEQELFPLWAAQGRLRAVGVHGRFIDIGTPESFAGAASFFE